MEKQNKVIKENNNRIGLCMIVKNESAIIERCLSSLIDIIDEYLIVDTGSTDNTIEKIQSFFTKHSKVTGKVLTHEWKNFGHNRTLSMQEAQSHLTVDWLLTIDADMILINKGFDSSKLDKSIGAYKIFQHDGPLSYTNFRLLNTKHSWKSIGVTHEFVESDNHSRELLKSLEINDIGDGGAKSDKFERDIRLLEQGLIDEPNNTRYMFYLANSYKDTEQWNKAIKWYERRIAAGGWYEEVTCSYEYIGICYEQLGKHEQAIETWLKCFEYNPNRAESLHHVGKNLREREQYHLAYLYISHAKKIKFPQNDILFINHEVYDWKVNDEYAVIAYWCGQYQESKDACEFLLSNNKTPEIQKARIQENLWFCKKALGEYDKKLK